MYDPTKPYKKQILELIKQTWETSYVSVKKGIYPVIEKKFSYIEVDHTDGIGTKGIYHWQQRSFRNAVLDALAMNLNDLALARARPYKLQSHVYIPKDDKEAILEIIKSLTGECKKRQIAYTGGETSIHNNMGGLDISITISGFIRDHKPNEFEIGDILIGFKSNGLHSNGFTNIREVFGKEYNSEFIRPTEIYLDTILKLDEKYDIHGMMHITGGAFTKLKDLLHNADAIISRNHKLKPQKILKELFERGFSDEEMYKTFNCGIGFVLSANEKDAKKIVSELDNVDIIGEVTSGSGKIRLESMFSNKNVEL